MFRIRSFTGQQPGLLIGYMRVSKTDGSQVLDLQRDALLVDGVTEDNLYSDTASGTATTEAWIGVRA